jgi:hypothetical protein
MSATTEVRRDQSKLIRTSEEAPSWMTFRVWLHRSSLDSELAIGADPNRDPLLRARAQELVGEKARRRIAESFERVLCEVDSAPSLFTSRAPIARTAVRETRPALETVVERLKAPAYVSPQGVAMARRLLTDGAGPMYGQGPQESGALLRQSLGALIDAIDHGPVIVA